MPMLKKQDFHYDLPSEWIAQYPVKNRSESRLMVLHRQTGDIQHKIFKDIVDYLKPNDLLVFNNSRVIPARIFAKKETGGAIEILIERILSSHTVLAHIRSSRSPKPGALLILKDSINTDFHGKELIPNFCPRITH